MTKWLIGFCLIVVLIVMVAAPPAWATACTHGTDCYADCVKGPATVGSFKNAACQAKNVPVDTSVLLVEDFEARTLYENINFGNQSGPDFGPWYDHTPSACTAQPQDCNRGGNSYWARTYGNGVDGALWANGQPTGPTLGFACDFGRCTGMKAWHPQNLWQANAFNPFVTVLRNGDFGAEVSSLTPPTGAAGGGSGVFDGQQTWGHRIGQGLGGDQGIEGSGNFGSTVRTFGATMAMAFPINLTTSRIMNDQTGGGANWKFNEWHPGGLSPDPTGGDGLFAFGLDHSVGSTFPMYGFMFYETTDQTKVPAGPGQNACLASLAAATKTVGVFKCSDTSVTWNEDTGVIPGSVYNQATDWPAGTWGCLRGTYVNLGSTNSSIKITFTPSAGPRAGTEITVVDISNWNSGFTWTPTQGGNGRLQAKAAGYNSLAWNAYYNGNYNAASPPNTGTNQVTFRYEDNIHIRAGAPVSCAQIGFGTSGGGPTTFQLNVSKAGTGTGTVTSNPAGINCGATCSAPFTSGSLVTLTATPSGGSTFTGWSGGGCSGTGTCTVPMSSDQNVTATFSGPTATLTVTRSGTGSGTVTSTGGSINCGSTCQSTQPVGTVFGLTATPSIGSSFGGWSGGGCSGFGGCTVTLNANTAVNAVFTSTGSSIIDAASCQLSDVQAAFNAVTAITTQVNIPAKPPGQECHWTGQAVLILPPGMNHDFAIVGAGSQTTDGGSNATVIVDDNTVNSELISIDASQLLYPRVFRISGLFIYRSLGVAKGQGFIKYIGANQVRVDHNTFYGFGGMYNMVLYCATGVIDRNIADFGFQAPVGAGGKGNCDQWGDFSWSQPTNFGTDGFLFLENNIFQPNDPNNPIGGNHGDCRGGGRIVVRYNNMRGVISHGDDGDLGRQRGCRALEVYGNTFTDASGGVSFDTVAIVTGTALVWGNNITTPGSYSVFTSLHMGRASTTEGPRLGWPNDWGFCGVVPTSGGVTGGGPSLIDQNTDSTGWRCLDMVGTGQGDLLVNDFPNVTNQGTGCGPSVPCVWPRNAREPVYEWLTTGFSGPGSQRVHPFETHVIIENRDYYIYQGLAAAAGGPFNGTVGTGSGFLSQRPETCTPGAGNTPGVGYWATDTQTLYVCTSTNMWFPYYRPFTYPHPLTGSQPQQQPPSAPSGFHFN